MRMSYSITPSYPCNNDQLLHQRTSSRPQIQWLFYKCLQNWVYRKSPCYNLWGHKYNEHRRKVFGTKQIRDTNSVQHHESSPSEILSFFFFLHQIVTIHGKSHLYRKLFLICKGLFMLGYQPLKQKLHCLMKI